MKVTSIMALLSGAIEPEIGLMSHWPILSPNYYLPPLPPFLAYFFTSFAYFLAPPFFGSLVGTVILLAA